MPSSSAGTGRPDHDSRVALVRQITQLMQQGKAAATAGQRRRADACFQALLQLDPLHEEAWLWRAGIARDPNQSLAFLTRVLEINPHNQRAIAGLEWARRRCELPPGMADTGATRSSLAGESTPPPSSELGEKSPQPAEARPKQSKRTEGGALGWLTLMTMALALLVTVVIGGLYLLRGELVSPALARTHTIDATPTPDHALAQADKSQLPQPTFTATASTTATLTATPTGTPTPPLSPPPPAHTTEPTVAPTGLAGDKWISVSLADQKLIAFEGDTPVFEAMVSTGLPRTPTVIGSFRIYNKLVSTTMSGADYYLPNVLYTQYYYKGFALHGTYWHDNFGQPMSHGCINMRNEDAEWLFAWTEPDLPENARSVQAAGSHPGTLIVIQ